MMRVMSAFSLVTIQVGRMPSVVPLSGSAPISGTGMNGAVSGLNQRDRPVSGAGAFTSGGSADGN